MVLQGKVFKKDFEKDFDEKKIDLTWLRQGVSLEKYLKYPDIKHIS